MGSALTKEAVQEEFELGDRPGGATVEGSAQGEDGGDRGPGGHRGEAPPPPVAFDELKKMTPDQVVVWLDGINFFSEFGDENRIKTIKQKLISHNLSGRVLIKDGGNPQNMIPYITYGPALELSEVILRINHEKGDSHPSFTNNSKLIII
ncbi:hypothetical protein B9Z19DRAFT_1163434 [Tuber borchii]|uniref:Uncharacterized protein n=1 Tax=Tuber borchii TaxID=42251 RepID=A0A2T6ZD12_TUBBO|nr:hypothetical protein B9Z19DRAFT_1163434 [Tuber borchii]